MTGTVGSSSKSSTSSVALKQACLFDGLLDDNVGVEVRRFLLDDAADDDNEDNGDVTTGREVDVDFDVVVC